MKGNQKLFIQMNFRKDYMELTHALLPWAVYILTNNLCVYLQLVLNID